MTGTKYTVTAKDKYEAVRKARKKHRGKHDYRGVKVVKGKKKGTYTVTLT